jgi:hypothetical protein
MLFRFAKRFFQKIDGNAGARSADTAQGLAALGAAGPLWEKLAENPGK